MKKALTICMYIIYALFCVLLIAMGIVLFNYDIFGHETYTKIEDYETSFELPEIRYYSARYDLFPQNVSDLNVETFYFEWELGVIGSADVETLLTVQYEEDSFSEEISRLQTLANGNVMYDEKRFSLPAYVTLLGEWDTSVYALVDDENLEIHYIYLQLLNKRCIDIPKEFLPSGYYGYGNVWGKSFDAYGEFE